MQTATTVSREAKTGRADSKRRGLTCLFVVFGLSTLVGCLSAPTVAVEDLLEPLETPRPFIPDDADLVAARLARAALVATAVPVESADNETSFEGGNGAWSADARVNLALAELRETEMPESLDDLEAIATDLRNATLDDPIAYRAASRVLEKRFGLDPRLDARLEDTIRNDPLRLAGRRQFDGWHRLWARTFNAVAEPLGTSAITGFAIAPF